MLSHTHPKYLNKTQSIAECIAFITARVDHEYNNLPHSEQLKKNIYIYLLQKYVFIYLFKLLLFFNSLLSLFPK